MIDIHTEDFDCTELYSALRQAAPGKTGAIVCFTGLVREFGDRPDIEAIELEHYPGMTEKVLGSLQEEASQRWPVLASTIVHRVGRLRLDEQIVFVGVASSHRQAAFEACEFIMDFLKTQAPFWKKEISVLGDEWVEAKDSDNDRTLRWHTKD